MKALIIVDVQNDFCPGGALAVKDGDQIVPLINELQGMFDLVVATQDWHLQDHLSFAINHKKPVGELVSLDGLDQILWPAHCVQGSKGAEFVKTLNKGRISRVFQKGVDKRIDSYSGFFDNGHRKATGLEDYLKEKGIDEVFVVGLATDYCVKFTAMDAARLGFKTTLVQDACKGVDLKAGDVQRALREMKQGGVTIVQSSDLLTKK